MEDKAVTQHPTNTATKETPAATTPPLPPPAAAIPAITPMEKLDASSIPAAVTPAEKLNATETPIVMEKPASSTPIAAETPTEKPASTTSGIAVVEPIAEKPVTDTHVAPTIETLAMPVTTENAEEKPISDTPAQTEDRGAEYAEEKSISDSHAQTEEAEEKPMSELPARTEDREIVDTSESFKEESYHLRDLKEKQKKALQEFKAKIQAAIMDNSFLESPKPEKAKKEEVKEEEKVKEEEVKEEEKKDESIVQSETDVVAREIPPPTVEAVREPSSDVHVLPPAAATTDDATHEPTATAREIPVDVIVHEPAPSTDDTAVTHEPTATAREIPVDVVPETPPTEDDTAATHEPTPTAREIPMDIVVDEPPPADDTAAHSTPIDESPSLDDLALWGIPLLHSKGDERTDVLLLKFLRARDFKVDKALNMLQDTMAWRKDFNTDSLIEEDAPTDFHGSFIHGTDRNGHPVCYNGELTSKKSIDDEEQLKKRIQVLEKGIQRLNFHPNGVHSMVQVTDFAGHSPAFLGRGVRSKILDLLQDNYPELVAKQIFINVPWYFKALLSLHLISPRTKSKVVLARPGRVAETLFKYISPDQVPVQYGGLSRLNDTDFEGTDAATTQITIKAGEKKSIELPVANAGRVVWDLAVTGWDVLYDEEFVPDEGYTRIIRKASKVASLEEPIRNAYLTDEPGKVVLTINNSISRRKRVAVYRYIVKAVASHT